VEPERELGGRQDEVGLVQSACLLPLSLCEPLALTVVLKKALSCTSDAPYERDLTERRNAYFKTENREQAHAGLLLLACRNRHIADILSPDYFRIQS
jgi:hypothetical protein